MTNRIVVFCYSVVSYAAFFCTFLYLAGFLANLFVPKSIDVGPTVEGFLAAAINTGLLLLFGLQHSVMARPGFKSWWTRFVPEPIERSTYVLLSSLVLITLFVFWQPLPAPLWQSHSPLAGTLWWGLYVCGLMLVLAATCLIDHFELFGLKQALTHLLQRSEASTPFQVQFLYRFVRHPLYLGWLITFWATPVMSHGHALFAAVMTGYILIAVRFEENDLIAVHGADYERYQTEVPMLLPQPGRSHAPVAGTAQMPLAGRSTER